jgi:autotransporter-associated beta strand protein
MKTRNRVAALLILAAAAMASVLPADAAPITIINPGFDDRVEKVGTIGELTDGQSAAFKPDEASPTGDIWRHWQRTENVGPCATWNPGTGQGFTVAPTGTNVASVSSRYTDAMNTDGVNYFTAASQLLTATFDPTKTYRLTAEVGQSPVNAWAGYAVQLVAGGIKVDTTGKYSLRVDGGTVVAQDNNSLVVPAGSFVTSTVTFTPGPAYAYLAGLPLQIRLCSLEDPAEIRVSKSAYFDNVKLDAYSALYWDLNGTTPGAGGATPAGIWNAANTNWNSDYTGGGGGTIGAWSAGSSAYFAAGADATGTYTVTVDGMHDIGGLTFRGGTVTLANGTSGELRMTGLTTVDIGSGLTATIQTPMSEATFGVGQLVLRGGGTLVLSSATPSTYTGGTTIQAGTLKLGAINVLDSNSPVTVAGDGWGVTATLDLNGYNNTIGALTLGGSGPTNGAAVTTGAGTLTLGGDVTYVTTSLSRAAPYTTTPNSTIYNDPLGATISGKLDLGSATRTFTVNDSRPVADDLTVSADISGTGVGLIKAGAGKLVLSGTNTHSGGTTLSAGTLAVGSNSALGSGALTINGGTIQTADSTARTLANALVLGSNVTVGGTGDLTFSDTSATDLGNTRTFTINNGVSTFAQAFGGLFYGLVKAGPGTMVLSGTNGYTGGTTVSAGVLQFNSAGAIAGSGRDVTVSAGATVAAGYAIDNAFLNRVAETADAFTVALAASSSNNLDFSSSTGASLSGARLGATGAYTYTGTLTPNGTTYRLGGGGGTLTLSNTNALTGAGYSLAVTGNVTLSAANNYDGGTTLGAGTLAVGNNGALGSGTLTFNGGRISSDGVAARTLANAVVFSADATLGDAVNNGKLTFGAADLGAATRTLTLNSEVEFTGAVSGVGAGLTKAGPGTLTLSGANTYGGATIVNAGTLKLGASGAVPLTSAVTVSGTGAGVTATLDLNGNNNTILSLALGGSTDTSAAAVTTGAGTLTLAGDVTYASTNNPLGATIAGKLDLGALTRTFTVNDSTTAADDLTVSAAISGTGVGLIKAGAGKLVLSGTNSYDSGTTVSAGVLQFNSAAAIAGAGRNVTVNAGAAAAFGPAFGLIQTTLAGRILATSAGAVALTADSSESLDFSTATGADLSLASLGAVGAVTYTGTLTPYGTTYRLGSGGGTLIVANTNALTGTGNSLIVGGNVSLSAANDYTGGTTLNAGILAVGNDGALGSGAVTFNGGRISSDSTTARTTANAVAFSANATLGDAVNNGKLTFAAADLGAATRTLTLNSDVEFTGAVSGGSAVGLNKLGAGTLTLSGANTYDGTTILGELIVVGSSVTSYQSGGTLKLSGSNSSTGETILYGGTLQLASVSNGGLASGKLTLGSQPAVSGQPYYGGTLQAVDNDVTLSNNVDFAYVTISGSQSITVNGTLTGVTNSGSGSNLVNNIAAPKTLTLGNIVIHQSTTTAYGVTIAGSGNTVINGVIANGGSSSNVFKVSNVGSGTTTLTGANTYTGGTTVNSGTLILSGSGTLGGGAAPLTMSGGMLDLGGTTNRTVGAVSILYPANFGDTIANGSLTGTSYAASIPSGNAIVSANLLASGSAGMAKSGIGMLTLSGANTYIGATTVSAGTLVLKNQNAVQNSTLTMAGGGSSLVFDSSVGGNAFTFGGLAAASTGAGYDIALQNNALSPAAIALTVGGNNANTTYAGVLSAGGSLTKVGAGALSLSGANTYSGGTNVNAGAVSFLNVAAKPSTGNIVVAASATLGLGVKDFDVGYFSTTDVDNLFANNFVDNLSNVTQHTATSNVGIDTSAGIFVYSSNTPAVTKGLVKLGANTLTLTGTNLHTGPTVINAGTLSVSADSNLGNANALVFDGGTLQVTGTALTSYASGSIGTHAVTQNADKTIGLDIADSSNTFIVSEVLSQGSGGLTKAGAGGLTLSGNNTYSGGTTLSAGTLNINAQGTGATNSAIGTGMLTITGGTIDATGGPIDFSGTTNNAVTLGGNFAFGGSNAMNLGTGAVTNAGNRTLTLNGIGSVLTLGGVMTNTANANQTTTVNGAGNTLVLGGYALSNNASNRTCTINGTGNVSITGPVTNGGTATASALTYSGTGVLTLSGANTYAGTTTVSSGRLVLLGSNNSAGATTVSGGTLQLGGTANAGLASGTLTFGGGSVGAAVIQPIGANRTITNNTVLNNTAGTILGSQSLQINGTFTNSGGNRTLANNLDPGTTLTLAGQVNLSENATTGRTLTVSGTGNTAVTGAIANGGTAAGVLIKTSIGQMTASGANSYTGATTLSGGGTLVLDYSSQDNSKLADAAALTLSGGTLTLNGGTHTEIVSATTLSTAGTFLTRSGGTAKLRMNAITRAVGGTISFADATIADTDTNNVNGILGGWATLGNDWAINSTGGADGPITALAAYTGALPQTGGVNTANYTLTGPQSQTGAVLANTVKITGTGSGDTLALGANNLTITYTSATSLGGILYAGGGDDNYTISGTGKILTSSTTGELVVGVNTGTLTITAPFVATGATAGILTKTGAGTLVANVANTYTGATYVNQGALRLMNATASGSTGGGIVVQNGAALELGNNITVGAEALTLVGAGISSGGALRNVAGNTSTYGGAITIGAGGARINSDAGGALTLTGTIATAAGQNVTFGGAGSVKAQTGAISGAGSLIKDGTGILTVTAANTYTGGTSVQNGALTYATTASKPASGTTTVAAGATLGLGVGGVGYFGQSDVDNLFAGTMTNVSNSPLSNVGLDTAAGNFDYSSSVPANTRGLHKLGANTLTLWGNNTYTGTTTLGGGTLNLGSAESVGVSGPLGNSLASNPGSIVLGGGTLQYSTANNHDYSGRFSTAASQKYNVDTNGQAVTWATPLISSTGSLTLNDTAVIKGTLTLSGANTYTGATTVTAGTLQLDGSTHASSTVDIGTAGALTGSGTVNGNATLTGSGIINKSSGTIAGTLGVTGGNWNGLGSVTGLVTSSSGVFTIGSSANLTADGDLAVTGGTIAAGDATSTITGSVNYTSPASSSFAGIVAGSGKTLTMNNPSATLTVGGANTYTGATTVSNGTLVAANATALGTTAAGTLVSGGATLDINNAAIGAEALTINGTGVGGIGALTGTGTSSLAGAVTLGSHSTIGGAGALTLSGGVGGAFNLTKTGAGTVELSGTNGYSGTTTVSNGRLKVSGTILNTVSPATIGATTATLELAGAGPVTPEGLDVTNAGGTLEIATSTVQKLGDISGTGTTDVKDGASLTANSIVQDTLIIGAGGSVTIREIAVSAGAAAGTNAVPEPGMWVLIGTALIGWLAFRRRNRR